MKGLPRADKPSLIATHNPVIRLLAGVTLLRHDLRGLRFLRSYLPSLLPGRDALTDGVPWMPFRAVAWLEAHLRPDMRVFEYGSGGSTIFLARRVASLISVEHDPAWHARVRQRLSEEDVSNCTYLLKLPQPGADDRFASTDRDYQGMNFETYVRAIDEYDSFDLVVVDGRARTACALHAVQKVKPGGYVVLDDSFRPDYALAMARLSTYPRIDLAGISRYNTDLGQTSIWQIRP